MGAMGGVRYRLSHACHPGLRVPRVSPPRVQQVPPGEIQAHGRMGGSDRQCSATSELEARSKREQSTIARPTLHGAYSGAGV